MTRRNPPAKWVLPAVIDPRKKRCFIIEVPDEIFHIAAFRGAILNLASATQWGDDPAHTARQVALVWRGVYDAIRDCPPAPNNGTGGEGEDTLIRQNPDNPCLLESSVDGVHWCAFADMSLCLSGGQPGAGAEQPSPGGGEACYEGTLQANSLWLLPTNVSTGDVLSLQAVTGAGNDGGNTTWYCPNGQPFLLGLCAGSGGPITGDPLNTVNHMRLLWKINTTYYDAMAGDFTIPAGFANATAILQVNDSALANNSGSYKFRVCSTNNQGVAKDISIIYQEWPGGGPNLAVGPAGVDYNEIFTITSNTSAFAIFAMFSANVKMEILGATNYVEFAPSPTNFDYMWVDTGGTRHNVFTNVGGPFPTDWNPATSVQAFGAVSDVSVAWDITVRLLPG